MGFRILNTLTMAGAALALMAGASSANAVVTVSLNSVNNVNDGAVINGDAGIQTNAYAKEFSRNRNQDVSPTNPGVTLQYDGSGDPIDIWTNSSGAGGNVTLAELPMDITNSFFNIHFNANEPGRPSERSFTLPDVMFTVDDVVVWNYDDATLGDIFLDGTTATQNNHSDFVLQLPVGIFLNQGFTGASEFEIFWTMTDLDSASPQEQWALGAGNTYTGDWNPAGGPDPDAVNEPAVLGLALVGLGGMLWLRRRKA